MEITRNFETAGGHKVEVFGQLSTSGKYEIDIVVEGFGSQGGTPALTQFSKDDIDYVAMVGKLPLTRDQLNIVNEVRRELMEARDVVLPDQKQYGTYDEVEILHSWWMKGTY